MSLIIFVAWVVNRALSDCCPRTASRCRAVEQVLHVVVGPGQLVHPRLQFRVDRLELFMSDCISSLDVVSSSLVDCNSSFVDCISSLVERSSSCELCISSRVFAAPCNLLVFPFQFRHLGASARCFRERPAPSTPTALARRQKRSSPNPARFGLPGAAPSDLRNFPVIGFNSQPLDHHGILLPKHFLKASVSS